MSMAMLGTRKWTEAIDYNSVSPPLPLSSLQFLSFPPFSSLPLFPFLSVLSTPSAFSHASFLFYNNRLMASSHSFSSHYLRFFPHSLNRSPTGNFWAEIFYMWVDQQALGTHLSPPPMLGSQACTTVPQCGGFQSKLQSKHYDSLSSLLSPARRCLLCLYT